MSDGHTFTAELDNGSWSLIPHCHEPASADCRLVCEEGCPEWGPLTRYGDGTVFHMADISDGTQEPHAMVPATDGCIVIMWLVNDEGLEEGGPGNVLKFPEVPFQPVWEGDYYGWKVSE